MPTKRKEPLSKEQILALPAAVDIPTAADCFGIGRSKAYDLARKGNFPVPVLEVGDHQFKVTRTSILKKLDIEDAPSTGPETTQDAA